MAHWSGAVGDIYPVGTSVSAYTAKQRSKSDGAPIGQPVETASVDINSRLTFTKLQSYTDYVAAAQIAGKWRYIEFLTPGRNVDENVPAADFDAVEDFGAPLDGTEAGTQIQAMIDHIVSLDGGAGRIAGDFIVNGTDLLVPANVPVSLLGGGMLTTSLKRTTGAGTILTFRGADFAHPALGEIRDLTIDGGDTACLGLDLDRVNDFYRHRVHVTNCRGGGTRERQAYNCAGDEIRHGSNGSPTIPAWLFDARPGQSQGGSATCLYENIQFEGNYGTDLKLTGDSTPGVDEPTNEVQILNSKFENGQNNVPYIDFDYCQNCFVNGAKIGVAGRNAIPVRVVGKPGVRSNKLDNLTVDFTGPGSAVYAIEQSGGGSLQLGKLNVIGGGTTAACVHVASDVQAGYFRGPTQLLSNVDHGVKDDRTNATPSVASAATINVPAGATFAQITGTTSIATIVAEQSGRRITFVFANNCTVQHGTGNVFLAGGVNFAATPGDTLTLVCGGSGWQQESAAVI